MTTQMKEAMAKATKRSNDFKIHEWRLPGNETLDKMSEIMGLEDREIVWMNRIGKLYCIQHPENGKLKYPSWQAKVEATRLMGALRPFFYAKTDQWVVHFFMLSKNDDLGGRTPVEYIQDKTLPMDVLIRSCEAKAKAYVSDIGAS